jgi:Putative methyltransferase
VEPDPDRRESLKHLAMGNESGLRWTQSYNHQPLNLAGNVGDLPFDEAMPIFSGTDTILKNKTGAVVIQIGSSSGREISYFASKFPDFLFIGTDIYPEVIDYSSANHKEKNLRFQILPAKDIGTLLQKFPEKAIVVISSGSLRYVQPEHLKVFFQGVGQYNAEILINEPGYFDTVSPDRLHGSQYRDNLSFTHDYRYYAEKAGLITFSSRVIRVYLSADHSSLQYKTVHYFYHGKGRTDPHLQTGKK